MRYKILRPSGPFDPRMHEYSSLQELFAICPVATELALEQEAADYARRVHPDMVAMPLEVEIGAGHIRLLGMVADNSQIDTDAIPFVMLVYAVAENNRDKSRIAAKEQFHAAFWRPDVKRPFPNAEAAVHEVSVRGTDLEAHYSSEAHVFRSREGKMTIYTKVGDVELSLEFLDPALSLIKITSG